MKFLRPETLGEAAALAREHEDAKFISGGTAVVLMLQQRLIFPTHLISLTGVTDVPGWREVRRTETGLRIGGGVLLSAVARSAHVRELAPSLASAAGVVGNARIRNQATTGGNVAESDYASDPPSVLVSLGATVEVDDGTAARIVPAAEMFTDFFTTDLRTGEVVTAVHVPAAGPGSHASYTKFCSRSAEDRPCVGVATAARLQDGVLASLEVVLGAVAAIPQRWPEVTRAALGRPLDEQVAQEVAEEYAMLVDPIDDHRGSAWYRREMVRVQVRRSLLELAGDGGAA
ncbi:FAD binding domain-containing protein [Blastococcus saxobsidens]|uniref:Carbon-monoxide dehydrogenase medium subunit n=1 Tax=Blastococcus saxobsidens TaxID=138336 RepID=A0A4Q7YBC1_9ACTN|nr:xanthine dehydrogenase family protein subunit M [Blastococcus saxobsidens]RZU33459.1 carbon-monoxide dehydrogenase medium subunit [Blastococcus saxobsidens]